MVLLAILYQSVHDQSRTLRTDFASPSVHGVCYPSLSIIYVYISSSKFLSVCKKKKIIALAPGFPIVSIIFWHRVCSLLITQLITSVHGLPPLALIACIISISCIMWVKGGQRSVQ